MIADQMRHHFIVGAPFLSSARRGVPDGYCFGGCPCSPALAPPLEVVNEPAISSCETAAGSVGFQAQLIRLKYRVFGVNAVAAPIVTVLN